MMCQWGWRGRNTLQVGEMRHEWLPSLTCAMLLVCVRSRQIPSVLSPFASVMGGWQHHFSPPPCFLLFFCREANFLSTGCCFMEVQGVRVAHLSEGAAWKVGHLFQLPSSTYWTGHSQWVSSTAWEKGGRKWNFWVLLEQWHILPCLPPPDLVHSWIMVCCPLHTSTTMHTFCTFAQEYLTWLWNTSSPPRNNRAPFVTISCLNVCIWDQYIFVQKTWNLLAYIE